MIKQLILGLLKTGPMHGYAVKRIIDQGAYSAWTDILPNSIYNAFHKLEKAGHIREHSTEYNGKQARIVYEITDSGRAEFDSLLVENLSTHRRCVPSELYLGLTYLAELREDVVLDAVSRRISALKQEIEIWKRGEEKKTADDATRDAMKMIFKNGLSHLTSDLELLQYVEDNLPEICSGIKRLQRRMETRTDA